MRKNLYGFLCLCILLSCGHGDDSSQDEGYYTISSNTVTSDFTISLSQNTPAGLRTLLNKVQGSYGEAILNICTWALIDSKHALTNSHCLSDKLIKDPSQNCSETISGVFSDGSGNKEERNCKRVIKASKYTDNLKFKSQDYAVIELSKPITTVKPFNFKRDGVSEGEELILHAMDHRQSASKSIQSSYNPKSCTVYSSDTLGTVNSTGSSPLPVFENCEVIKGNSGSPLTNNQNNLVGVISLGINEKIISKAFDKLERDAGVMTNLKCLPFGINKYDNDIEENCSTENGTNSNDRIAKEYKDYVAKKEEEINKALPQFIEFKLEVVNIGDQLIIYPEPKCIKRRQDWLNSDINKIQGGFFSDSIEDSFNSYKIQSSVEMDSKGNIILNSRMNIQRYYSLKVEDLDDAEDDKKVKIEITNHRMFTYRQEKEIPLCDLE